MKLRCTKNSVRIRLTKTDLGKLKEKGNVEEKVHFGNESILTFSIKSNDLITQLTVSFLNNNLEIQIPIKHAQEWMNTNQIGIEVINQLEDNQALHVLIEKDFPCIDRVDEDKSDTFWELAPDSPEVC